MARTRNIKPGFFKNEELAECNPLARILFAGLWTIADRDGRLEDRPKRIKAELLPYDNVDSAELLDELAQHGFIMRYCVGGQSYIQIVTFARNQQPHINEAASTIPPPGTSQSDMVPTEEEHGASTVQVPEEHGANTPLTHPLTQNPLTSSSDSNTNAGESGRLSDHDNATFAFEQFWGQYPRDRDGMHPGSKSKAKAEFQKISVAEWDSVMAGLAKYKTQDKVLRGYVINPETWLKDRKWREAIEAEPLPEVISDGAHKQKPSKRSQSISGGFEGAFGVPLEQVFGDTDEGEAPDNQASNIRRFPRAGPSP